MLKCKRCGTSFEVNDREERTVLVAPCPNCRGNVIGPMALTLYSVNRTMYLALLSAKESIESVADCSPSGYMYNNLVTEAIEEAERLIPELLKEKK